MPSEIPEYDVVVVGGGPVGLLVAYQLKRFGVSTCVLEQFDKETQDAYGRAIALFPRTTEQLDQLDLIDPMLQIGFACRTSVTYKDGKRVLPGRVWTFMEGIKDTEYDFALVLRQRYTEDIFRKKLDSVGVPHHQSTQCVDYRIDEEASFDSHAVTSVFKDKITGGTFELKSKYIVGADGARSFVRTNAGIPFEGSSTEDVWIRVDGLVETDMPITRSYGAIESKTHGNVLWAPLDSGATRIGYAYNPEIAKKYPDGVTKEVAVKEAIECMKPFKLKFKEVHWWTLYSIGQRIARQFSAKDRVFICGDAAHTHSSGAAQGLNTGIHDAVNLAWKLALQIRGLSRPKVLQTYTTERMTAVQRLINYDKNIATLTSGKWPSWYNGDPNADPHVALGEIFEEAASFNTGLGISYPPNAINDKSATGNAIVPGSRPPDVELATPGTNREVRLQRLTPNVAKFYVLVFTGRPDSTRSSLLKLRGFLDTAADLNAHPAIEWITISPVTGCSPYEAIGMKPFGNAYFDPTSMAHDKFGIQPEDGGVAILRPDGLVGSAGAVEGHWIRSYFSGILLLDEQLERR